FSPEQGIQLFEQVLSQDQALPPQVGILQVNWLTLLPQLPMDSLPAFFKCVAGTGMRDSKANILETLSGLSAPDRASRLQSYLQVEIARILGQSNTISTTRSFVDIGLDSLMAMELLGVCKRDLGLILYPREVFEHPTVEALSHYLAQELERTASGATGPATLTPQPSLQPSLVEFAAPMLGRDRTFSAVERKNAPAIFLLSSPRSGSTLLRVMLAGHPALFCPPELHLLPFETLAERQTALANSYLNEGLQRAVMELKGLDANASQALLSEWTEQGMTIPEMYHKLQTLAADRCLVDKSPTYGFSLSTLRRAEQVFEAAKYIHLARHPYAVIDSFVRNRMDKIFDFPAQDPYLLAHQVWTVNNQNILNFLAEVDPSRHYFLRYEDLVTDIEKAMGQLCDFLGISFHPLVLNPYTQQQRRMTDGVKTYSMLIDDPNFHRRRAIDPTLADAWKSVTLPAETPPLNRTLAQQMRYQLPGQSPPAAITLTLPTTAPLATMQEHWITVRGLDLCVCTWGPETGRSILCLHGVLDQGAIWDAIAPALVRHGYRVIAPDLRGHGKSAHVGPGGNYQVLDHLGDVDALVQHLGLETFPVVGHSMGAMIAASLASARPEQIQSLTLVEHIVPGDETQSTADQLTTHLNYLSSPPTHSIYATLAEAVDRFQKLVPALTPARAKKLAARIVEPVNGGLRWRWDPRLLTRFGLGGGTFTRDLYAQLLQHIQTSTTLIFGRQSDLNRPEDLAFQRQHLPQAAVVTIVGGHNLPLESPAEVTSELLRQLGHV
ncbi:MAG: alpha/beta fold hydrolase, partial [Pseudanabaenales cyanobacterium]|nr:alpha/beta fold hydrolase [Pseudanabaenales cyanobacterium]